MAADGAGISAVEGQRGAGDRGCREVLASRICRCFDVAQVFCEEGTFDGEKVSVSENMTSRPVSIASMEALSIWLANHDKNVEKYVLSLDRHGYYMMNVIDYLVGNTGTATGETGAFWWIQEQTGPCLCIR